MSRIRLYGSTNGTPFQRSTITFDEVPMPKAKRPGAASARLATLWAMHAGARVNAGHDGGAEAQARLPGRGQGQRA